MDQNNNKHQQDQNFENDPKNEQQKRWKTTKSIESEINDANRKYGNYARQWSRLSGCKQIELFGLLLLLLLLLLFFKDSKYEEFN